jgi:hypothetical protein
VRSDQAAKDAGFSGKFPFFAALKRTLFGIQRFQTILPQETRKEADMDTGLKDAWKSRFKIGGGGE